MKKIAIICLLFVGPAHAGDVPCNNCFIGNGTGTALSIAIATPSPQDLIINSRNEGLVLIRKIQACQSLAERLRDSPDIIKAECRQ